MLLNIAQFGFSFGAEPSTDKSAPGVIAFTLSSGGTYQNVMHFLEDIERAAYVISFSEIDISGEVNNVALRAKGNLTFSNL